MRRIDHHIRLRWQAVWRTVMEVLSYRMLVGTYKIGQSIQRFRLDRGMHSIIVERQVKSIDEMEGRYMWHDL